MLNLNIQFNGFNDLAAFIQTLQVGSSTLSKQVKAQEAAKPAEAKEAPPEVAPPAPQAEQKRRGRPPKEQLKPAAETPTAQDPTPAPAEPAKGEVTEADVQKALEEVFNTKGMNTARDLISRYGVKRLAELKREKYAEFVGHAKKVLAGEPV